ncbi:glycosyltransferase family 2 protein [Maritimibacter sp. DP1N21-5]|uniref:glycosyltransferase family 2 protein n=1 Tax=Maritimibacter sp. DP1N21-5 TaxID=2836867 RepID=UPI001C43BBB2|nr:glycosyltransferase family 2 protein [Maritimibacter sp. DP1N21-5]MBV7411098.1 glycosyltransferase [Maritimibacter sp. DP1N21-5]
MLRLFTALGLVILAAVLPTFGALICVALVVIQIALMALRPLLACVPARLSMSARESADPWFSVHVATHSEPPRVVIDTLRGLLDQDWPESRYEIIVMDNNTADDALWRPVERFCSAYPGRIRFLLRMGVSGAKAGALTIALEQTDPRASHIVTVDADYVVTRDFLRRAAAALHRTGADYVQFPQSYSDATLAAPGINAELEEYFRTKAARADVAEAVLLTGTLCVISRDALTAAGGWSGSTTTEDAELGVRLCKGGYSGRFINQVVGKGLLPLSLRDLERQRYRWCSGNFQTLMTHAATIFTRTGALSLHKRLVVLSQLTAWFNLALIPAMLLGAWLLTGRADSTASTLAACAIVLSLCDIVIRVLARGLRDGLPPGVLARALACRIALAPQSAKATFDALAGSRLTFVVTDKSGLKDAAARNFSVCPWLPFLAAAVLFIVAHPTNPLILAALGALMLPLPAAMLTFRSLRGYRQAVLLLGREAMA